MARMSSINNFWNRHRFVYSIYLIVARIFGNLLNLAEYFLTEFLSSNFLSLSFSSRNRNIRGKLDVECLPTIYCLSCDDFYLK